MPEYNFHQRVAIGCTTVLLFLCTFVVFLRLYIRCILLKAGSVGWDDFTVLIAWVGCCQNKTPKILVLTALETRFWLWVHPQRHILVCCDRVIEVSTPFVWRRLTIYTRPAEVKGGLGRHIYELTPSEVYQFELSLFIVIHCYNAGLNTVKISFLTQFYRIFPDRTIRHICKWFGFFCFFWMFVQALLYSFSCVPIVGLVPRMEAVCIPTLPTCEPPPLPPLNTFSGTLLGVNAECFCRIIKGTAISSLNVFTDLLIFCIPLKPLWQMPLLKRQRYMLIGIFCFGAL